MEYVKHFLLTSSFSKSSSISNTWLGILSGLKDLLKSQHIWIVNDWGTQILYSFPMPVTLASFAEDARRLPPLRAEESQLLSTPCGSQVQRPRNYLSVLAVCLSELLLTCIYAAQGCRRPICLHWKRSQIRLQDYSQILIWFDQCCCSIAASLLCRLFRTDLLWLFLLSLIKPRPCEHTLVFQGSVTLTMATSESLLSIPHICSSPRASQSCRF